MATNPPSPEMAICASIYVEPELYHFVNQRNGSTFFTDPLAKRVWPYFDVNTGLLDEIGLFQGDAESYHAFQDATSKVISGTKAHVANFIRLARRRWQLVVMQQAMQGLETIDPDEQIEIINNAVMEICNSARVTDTEAETEKLMHDIDLMGRGQKPEFVFGWPIDWMLEFEDLKAHELVVVGGRPGTGKSGLMGQLAYEYFKQGKKVLYLSLEMNAGELQHRWASYEVGFSSKRIANRPERVERYKEAFQRIRTAENLRVVVKKTLAEILAEINIEIQRGVQVIFIDYLQLIQTAKGRSREEEISNISRVLKGICMDGTPVIVGSQLNRQAQDEVPKLSHLRESGAIEQDADRVLLLHRDRESSYVIQAKLRNGPTGSIKTTFNGETTSFHAQSRWQA